VTSEQALEQRRSALVEANRRRAARANYRRHVRGLPYQAAVDSAFSTIINPPEWARSWRIIDIIKCIPGYGPEKTALISARSHIDLSRRADQLTPLQAKVLTETITRVGWTNYRRRSGNAKGSR
jgi:hypothetical protein